MSTSKGLKLPTSNFFFLSAGTILTFSLLIFWSCRKDGVADESPAKSTTLIIGFENMVDSLPLTLDTLLFRNSSGNSYKITDLEYFISDITLHRNDGLNFTATDDDGIHYVDARIASSLLWVIDNKVPFGTFDSISFTFGINTEKNISNRFLNPPERDMNWPEILGGGYHYMKMNLLWKNVGMLQTSPFNFHIGIGQLYKGNVINPDSIIKYVQNFFYVKLPASAFSVGQGQTKFISVIMNVNKWFTGNNEFDFSKYPNIMMQNQTAMSNACMNGRGAFRVRFNSARK